MNSVLELFGTISLDTKEYEKGIKNSGKQADEFAKKLDGTGKSSDNAGKKIEGVGTSADKAGTSVKSGGDAANALSEKLETAGKAADQMGTELDKTGTASKTASSNIDGTRESAEKLGSSSGFSDFGEAASSASDKIQGLDGDIGTAGRAADEMSGAFESAASSADSQSSATQKLAQKLQNASGNFDDAANSADDFSDSVNGAGDSAGDAEDDLGGLEKLLKGGLFMQAAEQVAALGEKLIGFGQSAMDAFGNVDSAVRKVTGYFAETGNAAKTSANVIKSVYEHGIGDSMDSVAQAIIITKRNLGELDETTLDNLVSQGMQLEDIFGIDLSETMRGVKALMTNFGLSGQDAMDLIVAGTQNGLDKTDELGDNISEYSGKFAQAGYSSSEYFQILENGLQGGAYQLDKVNDAINEVTTGLADGTIEDNLDIFSSGTQRVFEAWKNGGATQKDVIDSIVNDIKNCDNQQQALNMSAVAFGSLGEDGSLKFVESLDAVGNKYDDVSGKSKNMLDTTLSSQQKLAGNLRQLGDAFSPLGDKLTELANNVLPYVVKGVETLMNAFDNLPAPVQDLIIAVGLAAAAFAVLLPVISTIGVLFSTFGGVIGTIAAPLGIVIGLITSAILVFENWGTVVDVASSVLSGFVGTVASVFESIRATISNALNTISNVVQVSLLLIAEIISAAAQILFLPVTFVMQNFGTQISAFFSTIGSIFSSGWAAVSSATSAAWSTIYSSVSSSLSSVLSVASSIMSGVISAISSAWNSIRSTVSSAVNAVRSTVSSGFNALVNAVSSPLNGIKNSVTNTFNSVRTTISNVINSAKSIVSSGLNAIRGYFSSLSLKFPHIKLPRFSISGSFSLNPPSVPHFSVSWYKRAMAGAYLLDSPTLFGTASGIAGGGEAGNEYIVGQNSLAATVRAEVDNAIGDTMPEVVNYLAQILQAVADGKNIYLDGKTLVGGTVEEMDKQLGKSRARFRRGLA